MKLTQNDTLHEFTFIYDGDGNRTACIEKVTGEQMKRTFYIAGIYEREVESEKVTKYYSFGGRVTTMRINGTIYHLLSDHLGSTSLVTDTVGNVQSQMRYLPFGAPRWSTGDQYTDKTYTGQRSESLGLMDYNARFYDPYLNRFLSPDTIIPDPYNPLDWDRYSYVRNNPIKYTDPTGHFTDEELAKLMGYKSVKEMYSSDWWNGVMVTDGLIDLLHEAQMGDIVEFSSTKDKDKIFKMMFCENEEGRLSFWLLDYKQEVNAKTGISGLEAAGNWALFTREDKRFFDKYNPSLTNHKGEYLPAPEMNNNIGVWGGAIDDKPGDVYWEEKIIWQDLIVAYGEYIGGIYTVGAATYVSGGSLPVVAGSLFPGAQLAIPGWNGIGDQKYLEGRIPVIH